MFDVEELGCMLKEGYNVEWGVVTRYKQSASVSSANLFKVAWKFDRKQLQSLEFPRIIVFPVSNKKTLSPWQGFGRNYQSLGRTTGASSEDMQASLGQQ